MREWYLDYELMFFRDRFQSNITLSAFNDLNDPKKIPFDENIG